MVLCASSTIDVAAPMMILACSRSSSSTRGLRFWGIMLLIPVSIEPGSSVSQGSDR